MKLHKHLLLIVLLANTSFIYSYSTQDFYKHILEIYKKITNKPKELETLREEWQDDKKTTAEFADLVKAAQSLRNHYLPDADIYSLGQSPSYFVLTAQLIEALEGANPERYHYIAFSHAGGSKGKLVKDKNSNPSYIEIQKDALPNLNEIKAYYHYLHSLNFFQSRNNNAIICEQVETGNSIIFFEYVLESITKAKLLSEKETMPFVTWYIHLFPVNYYGIKFHIKTVDGYIEKDLPKFNFVREIKKELPQYPLLKLSARGHDELRLVPSFDPKDWVRWYNKDETLTASHNPSIFALDKEAGGAEELALQILDFIIFNKLYNDPTNKLASALKDIAQK